MATCPEPSQYLPSHPGAKIMRSPCIGGVPLPFGYCASGIGRFGPACHIVDAPPTAPYGYQLAGSPHA